MSNKHRWLLAILIILSLLSVLLNPDATIIVDAKTTYPYITQDLLDYRPLEEKFSEFSEDFRLSDIEAQMQSYNKKYRSYVYLWSADLDVSPGTIIYDDYMSEDKDPTTRVVISVPKINQNHAKSNLLKDYGVFEVLSYYQTMGQYEYWRAEAKLCIYNKAMLREGHPVKVDVNSSVLSPFVETSIPLLSYEYCTDDYKTEEELLEEEAYTGEYLYAYYGNDYLMPVDIEKTVFTANSFDFSEVDLKILARYAEKLNIATRKPPEQLYNDAHTCFDFFTFFRDPEEGALDGIYELRNADDRSDDYIGFIYINDETVIAVKTDEILIGISARSNALEDKVSVDTDRLYIASYFKDESKNPKTINIDSRFPSITKETLEKLIYLLYNSEIDLDNLNVNSLNLE